MITARLDWNTTAVRHYNLSKVIKVTVTKHTTDRCPLSAVTLTYLFIYLLLYFIHASV